MTPSPEVLARARHQLCADLDAAYDGFLADPRRETAERPAALAAWVERRRRCQARYQLALQGIEAPPNEAPRSA